MQDDNIQNTSSNEKEKTNLRKKYVFKKVLNCLGNNQKIRETCKKIPLLGNILVEKDQIEQERNQLREEKTQLLKEKTQLLKEKTQLQRDNYQLQKANSEFLRIIQYKDNLIKKLQEIVQYRDNLVEEMKFLYISAVGRDGKDFLKKIIRRFGYKKFDYLIFVYDDTEFSEEIFKKCKFIYEKGTRWQFLRNHVSPDYCKNYDYIFVWPDDIDIDDFSYEHFLKIMFRNHLDMAQPALTPDSYYFHKITVKDDNYKIGRVTDFVEIMIPVFSRDAYIKYWKMIDQDFLPWGHGYDYLAKSICEYNRMGIVDCESVRHTRPIKSGTPEAASAMESFLKKYSETHKKSEYIIYGPLF